MFQHPRSGQGPFLGDMTDEDHRGPGLLGMAGQFLGAFPNLGNATRRRLQGFGIERLDGIDDRDLRLFLLQCRQNRLEADLGQDRNIATIQTEPIGPHRNLGRRLLATDVKRLPL